MDALWYRRYRREGGEQDFVAWETSAGVESYDEAGPPAQVGRRVAGGFLGRDVPPESARAMNNAVHWLTGVGWGTVHGLVVGSLRRPRAAHGLATGVAAWSASYALLGAAGVYKPIWEYPVSTLWEDLSAHLVFGLGTGATFAVLSRPGSRSTRGCPTPAPRR
jgi:hypothetical protein